LTLGIPTACTRKFSPRHSDLDVELDLPRFVLVGGCVLLSRGFWLA
jgi:hypothetical protein